MQYSFMRSFIGIIVMSLALTGCHMWPEVPEPVTVLGESTVPPSGVYDLSQVVIVDRNNEIYEFAAASRKTYPEERLFALMWCRADEFARENGYKGWYMLSKDTKSLGNAVMAQGIVQMFRTSRQDKRSGLQKDWCLAWEAPMPLELENTKPILQYPSNTDYPANSHAPYSY
jgi:hypothetical protein